LTKSIASMIVGTGVGIPTRVLTNQDLEKMVDTTDAWIRERTGMESRRLIEEGRYTSDLCTEAALMALQDAGMQPMDLDMIIVATVTGDLGFPATACLVQHNIAAYNAAAFDVAAACSGFLYGLATADAFIACGKARNVLVIGGETLSRMTDYTDRNTCVLFGDGAGAAILTQSDGKAGVLGTLLGTDGRFTHLLQVPGFGTKYPPSLESVEAKSQFIQMEGREVFKQAVTAMGEAATRILEIAGITSDQVDLLIPHQANLRIIEATAKRVAIPSDRVFINLKKYGNTSAASIPIALDEARRAGRLRPGQIAVLVAFGAGLTWASAAVRF
jgi:3-oxoacyl-[acyl-carrier-protein] synthase III